jgi:hypothetical protein
VEVPISRRIVTNNQQWRDFKSMLSDARKHFETLTRIPDVLLRHLGSPFAPCKDATQPGTLAA